MDPTPSNTLVESLTIKPHLHRFSPLAGSALAGSSRASSSRTTAGRLGRVLGVLTAGVLTAGTLSACQGGGEPTKAAPAPPALKAPVPTATAAPSVETGDADGKSKVGAGGVAATSRRNSTGATAQARPGRTFLGRRAVDMWLIDALDQAQISPPLAGQKPARDCLRGKADPPVINPLSTLSPEMRKHNLRLGLTAGLRRRDIRQIVTFKSPRRLTWQASASAEPRLELDYLLGCKPWRVDVTMTVTVTRPNSPAFSREIMLHSGSDIEEHPWRSIAVDLPVQAGERFELTIAVQGAGKPTPTVALANPRITGRPKLNDKRKDLSVLLVIVDALRSDLVGPDRRTDLPQLTPNIDRLSKRGAIFTEAYSAANQTRSSTLAMLMSQPPSLGGYFTTRWVIDREVREKFYAKKPPLLTMALREAGYTTTTFGHNRFLWADHPMGLDHGFDRIFNDAHPWKDTERLTRHALKFLDENKDDRFFLYLNLVTPHLPYIPPEEWAEKLAKQVNGEKKPAGLSANYLAEVAYADHQIGRVMDRLDKLGIADDTIVIITADHGEVFKKEHACWSQRYSQNCQYNHGLTLYREETHVPLVIVSPRGVAPGTVVRQTVSQLNLAPTVLDLVGLPEDTKHVGRSLRPELNGVKGEDEVIYTEGRRVVAIQKDGMKLHIHHANDDAWPPARRGLDSNRGDEPKAARYQLFDLKKDPDETVNLALGKPDPRLDDMLASLKEARATMAARMQREEVADEQPAAVTPQVKPEPATNVLMLRGDGKRHSILATLKATNGGHLLCGEARDAATCQQLDQQSIRVTLVAQDKPAGVVFQSHPWDEPIEVRANLDGKPFDPSALRLGAYGLKLLDEGETLASSITPLNHAAAQHPPRLESTGDMGVFFWRSVPQHLPLSPLAKAAPKPSRARALVVVPLGPESIDAPKDAGKGMTKELRKALREMGYSQ